MSTKPYTFRIVIYICVLLLAGITKTNSAGAQEQISITGEADAAELKNYIRNCLVALELEHNFQIDLIISKSLSPDYEGMTYKLNADSSGKEHYSIHIKHGLRPNKMRVVLAHELIHVKQYVTGRLAVDGGKVKWLGRKFHLNYVNILYTPWENEAYATDYMLSKKIERFEKKNKNSALAVNSQKDADLPLQQ